jgi:hypothetical protein
VSGVAGPGVGQAFLINENEENPMNPTAPTVVDPAVPDASASAGTHRMLRSLFADVGLAVLAYYGARLIGLSEYTALLAGTVVSGLRLAWVALRSRRLDPFAVFMMVLFGAGLALTFATGDARFVLVKDSFTTGLAGLMFLGSALVGRPLSYYAAQRFAGPAGAAAVRERWSDPRARRAFGQSSLVWGLGLLTESLARLPLIYLLPLDVAVGASTVLQVVAYSALIAYTLRFGKRMRAAAAARS